MVLLLRDIAVKLDRIFRLCGDRYAADTLFSPPLVYSNCTFVSAFQLTTTITINMVEMTAPKAVALLFSILRFDPSSGQRAIQL
jgi:hypothetical protein